MKTIFKTRRTLLVTAMAAAMVLGTYAMGVSDGGLSREEAYQIVLSEGLGDHLGPEKIYAGKAVLPPRTIIKSWKDQVVSPEGESWFFFIDDHPAANWGHPCRYVFVDAQSGAYSEVEMLTPPPLAELDLLH
jgi:hypothetical protein